MYKAAESGRCYGWEGGYAPGMVRSIRRCSTKLGHPRKIIDIDLEDGEIHKNRHSVPKYIANVASQPVKEHPVPPTCVRAVSFHY